MDGAASRVRVVAEAGFEEGARLLAERLGVPPSGSAPFELVLGSEGLGLRPAGAPVGTVPVRARLNDVRPGSEEVVRAVRGRRSLREIARVVDATAGLGADASALARSGLRVVMIERDPVLHALLEDGLARLSRSEEPKERDAAARLSLVRGDAADVLGRLAPSPDVVYLDPMYPEGRGGAKRRPMAWVRELLGEESFSSERDLALLVAARHAATRRVVQKRPAKAPPLSKDVSGSLSGRTTRFDLYAPLPPGPGDAGG